MCQRLDQLIRQTESLLFELSPQKPCIPGPSLGGLSPSPTRDPLMRHNGRPAGSSQAVRSKPRVDGAEKCLLVRVARELELRHESVHEFFARIDRDNVRVLARAWTRASVRTPARA